MSFIGIAIFILYTKAMVYVGSCDPHFSTTIICADVLRGELKEEGAPTPIYFGEFPSVEACQHKSRSVKYPHPLGNDQRIGDVTEVLCVPKTN